MIRLTSARGGFWKLAIAAALLAPASAFAQSDAPRAADPATHWISGWATAQQLAPQPAPPPPPPASADRPAPPPPPQGASPIPPFPESFTDQTVRMVVRPTIDGDALRVQLSNAMGAEPLRIGAAHIARSNGAARIDVATDHALTFGGKPEVTIQPGAIVVSDPVEMAVPAFQDLAVSLYVPGAAKAATVHPLGLRTTFVASGDATAQPDLPEASSNRSYFWLTGLDLRVAADARTIVAFGDSITDGYITTPDAGAAWPELLARRLQAASETANWSVINMGISGNRVRRDGAGLSAFARFDRDVLSRPGVAWIILLEGINDINFSAIPGIPESEHVTAEQLIDAYRQLIAKAHLHGIRVMGATILPTGGLWLYGPETESIRTKVNDWIRTSDAFDAVVDFDAVTRDPAEPTRLRPDFDPGDHVHPNDAGNVVMAEAVDIGHFAAE